MSSSDIEKIKDKIDIVDLISSYIKVEKAGINHKAKCPFHNEKTPSFFISQERQSFYCFGCQSKGDIFSFVEKFEGVDFRGALEMLAGKAGVELKANKDTGEAQNKNKLFEIMEEATKIYEENLKSNGTILEYLKNRGLESSTISKWRLGFAEDDWRNLHDKLMKKEFTREVMLKTGLIKKSLEGDKYYDTFRNRIVFPISDSAGRVIAFSGRAMKEDEKTPKYLNSPETELFHKSEVLYGLNIAKHSIRKLGYAILVEGQMDLLMSYQVGTLNTVASSGTALTESHVKKIQKLANKVIIAYDGDDAGEKAAKRAAEITLSLDMETKMASLEKDEDPASIIKKDPEIWKGSLRKSSYFLDFLIDKISQKFDGDKLIREMTKEVIPLISLIKSDMEKSRFVKKISIKTGISENLIWNDIKKTKQPNYDYGADYKKAISQNKSSSLEKILISLIFLEESSKNLEGKENAGLREDSLKILGEEKINNLLRDYEKDKESLIFEIEKQNITKENLEKTKKDILKRIEFNNLKTRLQETGRILDEKNISKEKEDEIKTEVEKIQKRIKDLEI